MTDTIYTVQTPGVPNDSNPGGITVGTVFHSSVNGTISSMRWYFPTSTPGVPVQAALYLEGTQAVLATGTFAGGEPAGWNTATLTPTVNITAGTNYVIAVWTDDHYVATVGQFNGSSISNGALTAPADNVALRNGRFRTGGSIQFPTDSFGGNGYFVDVLFDPTVEATIVPDGILVPITLGSPELVQEMSIAPDGILVPITLGTPTLEVPTPLGPDWFLQAGQFALDCLCDAVALHTSPPAHCRFQVGLEGYADIAQNVDECCDGVAYVALGDVYPSFTSFPEADIVGQARERCQFSSWAVELRLGIIRCAPRGTNEHGPTDDDWNAAALNNFMDSQVLRRATCCIRSQFPTLAEHFDGMSVVIGRQSQLSPAGGCVERYVNVQLQIPNCECRR